MVCLVVFFFFFFNDTATTEIYTLSLHDALPILRGPERAGREAVSVRARRCDPAGRRSEEHTSELQSQSNLVCRLLLEKKKTTHNTSHRLPCEQHQSHAPIRSPHSQRLRKPHSDH